MHKTELKMFRKAVFWCSFAFGVFMTVVCFLGFIGWVDSPSNQKWLVLGRCLFCAVATFLLWRYRDEFMQPFVDKDEQIKIQAVGEQRRYWQGESRAAVANAALGAGGFWLLAIFSEMGRAVILIFVGFAWFNMIWRIVRARRELAKLG